MGSIRPFLRNRAFNPETVEAMSRAFESAKVRLSDHDEETLEALAMRIVTLASCGEIDPERLTDAAVKSFTA